MHGRGRAVGHYFPLQAQNLPAMPALQTQGVASFTCGGIGEASSKAMLVARKDYPVSLVFATASGECMASVNLTGRAANAPVDQCEPEPSFMAIVHRTDAVREWAYDVDSNIGKLKPRDARPRKVQWLDRRRHET